MSTPKRAYGSEPGRVPSTSTSEENSVSEPVALTYEVRESGTVPVITHVPAFAWRCGECGWLGTGLGSENSAKQEAARHTVEEHDFVPCRIDVYGDPHAFRHVDGSDSLSECTRCKWVIGK